MIRSILHPVSRVARFSRARGLALAAALLLSAAPVPAAPAALGHSPDPSLGGTAWYANQTVPYTWTSGQVPPSWLQDAFNRAASDSNATRGSRAAVFSLKAGATSRVAYGEPTGCSAAGIACFSRSAPSSFRIWYRAHGYRFDWGILRWCQGPSGYVTGCFDVETAGLDELGHVEGLGHHVNYGDGRDYGDAVVQAITHSLPGSGWQARAYGRCDVARLQMIYDRPSSWDRFSTCLSLTSTTGIAASASWAMSGTSVLFTATVRSATTSMAGALSGDPVSGRTVVLERRFPGASAWTTVATMAPQAADGTYATTVSMTGTYEWRATFRPVGEGIAGSSSAAVMVTVQACSVCANRLAAQSGGPQ